MGSGHPIDRGLRFLTRRGLREGLTGGSRVWAAVAAAAVAARWIRRSGRPRTVFSAELRPGEALVISHQDRSG